MNSKTTFKVGDKVSLRDSIGIHHNGGDVWVRGGSYGDVGTIWEMIPTDRCKVRFPYNITMIVSVKLLQKKE